MSTPRIRLPRTARPGETVEVRTLLDHPMVTGLGSSGPRDMLARFEVAVNGETVLTQDYANGSAANPTAIFHVRLHETSRFQFVWTHEDGRVFTAEQDVRVG